ncbi:MAG TPA: S53 family peptidase [Anaerolineales bacterium]|nr:S53 family peptidase [Anaerolineales bacterium]
MSPDSDRVSIPGSRRTAVPGAQAAGAVPAHEKVEVTLRLRPRNASAEPAASRVTEDALPSQRRYLTRAELRELQSPEPGELARVKAFARSYGLKASQSRDDRCSVTLKGKAAAFNAAFGVELQNYEHPDGNFRGRTGELSIPAELEGIVQGVFGLDDRPQTRPHFQVHAMAGTLLSADQQNSFTPLQLAKVYQFPTGLDGSGECIAIIELGGGYRSADLKAYFTELGLPAPKVKAVGVDGGRNQPSTANGADGEVMLDIEVAAALAPKARIVVYFAPNTDRGFLDAISQAIHDTANKPSVISISWGGPESSWTSQAMGQFDQAFQAAAALGVTVCAAAGDNGSADGVKDGKQHVDFPASSPYVLGCGGTRLAANGTAIASETVWNEAVDSATGGGISVNFPSPAYQNKITLPSGAKPGRGIPDVAGDADPATGYRVRVDGQNYVIGGTSAVAPLWSGLIALFNQKLKTPVGFLNPLLYGSLAGKGLFNDVTSGNNGAYAAATGWDACTGWGSPIGARLLAALGG